MSVHSVRADEALLVALRERQCRMQESESEICRRGLGQIARQCLGCFLWTDGACSVTHGSGTALAVEDPFGCRVRCIAES
jgi:hypothetical protein